MSLGHRINLSYRSGVWFPLTTPSLQKSSRFQHLVIINFYFQEVVKYDYGMDLGSEVLSLEPSRLELHLGIYFYLNRYEQTLVRWFADFSNFMTDLNSVFIILSVHITS